MNTKEEILFNQCKVSLLSCTQTLICSVVKGYLSANTLQPEVLKYLENLYQDKMVGLRNYAYIVSNKKCNQKMIEMQLQFKPGKAKEVQTIRNILTGKTKLGQQQPFQMLLKDDLEVCLNGLGVDKKKSAKAKFQYITSQKGHVKKMEHFTSQGMREITNQYGKHLVIVNEPLPTATLKDMCFLSSIFFPLF